MNQPVLVCTMPTPFKGVNARERASNINAREWASNEIGGEHFNHLQELCTQQEVHVAQSAVPVGCIWFRRATEVTNDRWQLPECACRYS